MRLNLDQAEHLMILASAWVAARAGACAVNVLPGNAQDVITAAYAREQANYEAYRDYLIGLTGYDVATLDPDSPLQHRCEQ